MKIIQFNLCFWLLFLTSGGFVLCHEVKVDLGSHATTGIWMASGFKDGKHIVVAASVPGGIYSDLAANGSIFTTEIYYRYNDLETRWVGQTNWNFSRTFVATPKLFTKQKIVLTCDGLDTVSSIYVNDVLVGITDNMFVRYEFNIKTVLQHGVNRLTIAFQSPVDYAQKQWLQQAVAYPVPPACVPPEYHGECHANHIRKMQASFSWDWGPSYPSSGIWKDIYIKGFNTAVITDAMLFVSTNATIPDETATTLWNVTARVWLDSHDRDRSNSGKLSLQATVNNGKKHFVSKATSHHTVIDISFFIPGNEVSLWWPNGYGKQALYNFTIKYKSTKYNESSTLALRGGFRTLELVEDPIDTKYPETGLSFYFRVNGIPIYAKGSNFIPIHVLPERATLNMTEWLLESAKEANMNMIRVWGGGVYESDSFYKLADEKGLMIWQDFMFACAMYPTNTEFLSSVRHEVATQVKRLQHHPCIVVWAANNENEAALRGNWYGTKDNFTLFAEDFVKLYIDTIKDLVNKLDPSRTCLSSSPTNGKNSETQGWIAKNPYSNLYGDVHFYNYKNDSWNWSLFPKTRFASEYGFQSWPHPETLLTGTSKRDWSWFSEMILHRQHHPDGQIEIQDQIKMHLPLPTNSNSTSAFTSMLYLAQVTQSMSMKIQTESYRRLKGQLFENGEGLNAGALYWQLNDIWQGASWASIEMTGRWKLLHYYARNFFAKIITSPFQMENGNIGIYVVSDDFNPFKGNLRISVFTMDNMVALLDYELPVSAAPFSAALVHEVGAKTIEECYNSVSICILYISMAGTPDNFLFLHYPNETSFIQNPQLKVSSTAIFPDEKTFLVTLRTQEIAPFVFLNIKDNAIRGWFSDNGFIMVNPSKTIVFKSKDPLTLKIFEQNLEVMSLHDVI